MKLFVFFFSLLGLVFVAFGVDPVPAPPNMDTVVAQANMDSINHALFQVGVILFPVVMVITAASIVLRTIKRD